MEPSKEKKKSLWSWIIWGLCLPLLAIIFWLIYRAAWTLSALRYGRTQSNPKYGLSQNNIQIFTTWGKSGTEFQAGYYGHVAGGYTAAGLPVNPLGLWLYGWVWWWAIPYLLLSPGFYKGLLLGPAGVGGKSLS